MRFISIFTHQPLKRPPTEAEMAAMGKLIADAMKEGWLISTEGATATFHVEARDEHEVIARGLHKRGIIRVESFARRVARKNKGTA